MLNDVNCLLKESLIEQGAIYETELQSNLATNSTMGIVRQNSNFPTEQYCTKQSTNNV